MNPATGLLDVQQDQDFNVSANDGSNNAAAQITVGLQNSTSIDESVIPGSYIIVFKKGADKEPIKRLIVGQGGQIGRDLWIINGISAELPLDIAEAFIETLRKNPAIKYIDPNCLLIPDDCCLGFTHKLRSLFR